MVKLLRIALFLLPAGGFASASAFAQAPPKVIHIYRGLYGPTDVEDNLPQRLFFTLSTYGAADDSTVFAGGTDIADAPLQAHRFYQGAQTRLSLRRQRARSLLNFDTTSAMRYYPGLHDVTTSQHGGTLESLFVLSPRLKVQLGASGSYAPYYQVQPGQTSGLAPAPEQDFSVTRQKTLAYGGVGAVTFAPTRHSELIVNGGGRYTQFLGAPDFTSHSAGARFTERVSRDFALVLGYSSGVQGRSDGAGTRTQNIDAGVNYSRGLWVSARTSMGFSTGSAIVAVPGGQRVELTGSAFVKHQLSGRWTAQIAVTRGLQAVETAPRPFIGETLTGNVSGYFSRRISLRLVPAYGHGTDVATALGSYRNFSNQARIEVAFSRFWAVYAEHFYYSYRTTGGADIGLLPGVDRQGVRTGLVLWAPLVR